MGYEDYAPLFERNIAAAFQAYERGGEDLAKAIAAQHQTLLRQIRNGIFNFNTFIDMHPLVTPYYLADRFPNGGVEINFGDRKVNITSTEFSLLAQLERCPGESVNTILISEATGYSPASSRKLVSRLRQKLNPSLDIRPTRQRGYHRGYQLVYPPNLPHP